MKPKSTFAMRSITTLSGLALCASAHAGTITVTDNLNYENRLFVKPCG